MPKIRGVFVVGSFLLFSPVSGQSPVSPPTGAASVSLDTILALATDTVAFPELNVVTLVDEGSVRIEEDGTTSATFRIVRQALRSEAVRGMSELELRYSAGHQDLTLNWLKVVDPDSGVISSEPIHQEELDVDVSRDSPIYTDMKRFRLSVGGMAAGRILDYSYTVRDTAPILPGDLWRAWNVNSSAQILRSRFVVDVAEGANPRVRQVNLPGPTREELRDGRKIREWSYTDLDRVETEPFAADSNGVAQTVTVTGWVSWEDIAAWYADLSRGRLEPTPAVQAKLEDLGAGGGTPEETLRRAHRWISQDVRYISISLGLGGYQPRPPDEVIETLSGDCKDKATLFVAMARALGFEAYPVLVRTAGEVLVDYPSIQQFNHMVAAVKLDRGWHYLDLTVPYVPFDETFSGFEGKTTVLLKDDGSVEMVSFPKSPSEDNQSEIRIEGTLDEDGNFQGSYTETVTGGLQYRMRSEFARSLNSQQMESLGRNLAGRVFPEAKADSVEIFDGRDLDAQPRLWARVSAEDVLKEMGADRVLTLRIPKYGSRQAINGLESDTLRLFPLDAEKVFGRREHITDLRITLPEGWTAEIPPTVVSEGIFGRYEGSYEQDGRTLVVRRSIRGTDGVYPPDRVADLIEWWEGMLEDDVEFILLHPATGR